MSAGEEKERISGDIPRSEATSSLQPMEFTEKPQAPVVAYHPAVYVVAWITMSSSVILFNKWILDTAGFRFPIILTTWHLAFGTLMTQILSRTTTLLDGRKKVKMTGRVYLRAIMPIGLFFSLSLICGNLTYLYLSVAFIQMLKATTPVAVLLSSWVMGLAQPNLKVLFNISFIVAGVIIASFGEIKFVLIGVLFQLGGVIFEAIRLTLVQSLLSSAEYKMDPLVSFYYFAPVCAIMNGLVSLIFEVPYIHMSDIARVGYFTLLANAMVAFGLNVCVVFLIGRTSAVVMTLCGVLKDILLVFASIMIWGTPVTALQYFGYSIALGGMVYYKLGAESIKSFLSELGRSWAEYGAKHPVQRKVVIFGMVILTILVVLGGLAPSVGYDPGQMVMDGTKWWSSKEHTTNGS
ncbi:hypothetical protein MMC26_002002 [Xylographa opegraphella]|nr:hypothetical protein [Xylographa opegraphella]